MGNSNDTSYNIAELFKVKTESKINVRTNIFVNLLVNKVEIKIEIDTKVAVAVIGKQDYLNYFNNIKLEITNLILKSYCGAILELLGYINVQVQYKNFISYRYFKFICCLCR